MKLSIIVVNYKTKDITLNCLRSLDKFPYSGKFEVLLVDNGSHDGSVKVFKNFKPKKYLLKIIENRNNLGFSKANNIGIKKSKGEYVLLLNSDTITTKNAIDGLVSFAQERKDAGVVVPRLLNVDKSVQGSVFRKPTLVRTIKQYWLQQKGLLDKYAPKASKPVEVEVAVGAAFLITPEARKKVGLLNEKYFMFFEDFDYCRKVRNAGLKIYYLPHSKIIHLHGKSGEKLSQNKDQWKRLIPGSKIYHGVITHYLIWFVIRTSQLFS